jgi:DNA-binding NarL/FixJ family response regulator
MVSNDPNITNKIPVWIIDDNKSFCVILAAYLNKSQSVDCQKYFNAGKTALKALQLSDSPPSVILLDIKMPQMSGLEAIGPIKKVSPATNIIMLTSHDLDENIRVAMKRGASGYLLKSSTPEEVIAAIEIAEKGGLPLDPQITKRMLSEFIGRENNEKAELISPREKEVIKLIIEGLSNSEIARNLFLSTYTVATHVKNIFFKLDIHNRQNLVAIAIKNRIV